MSQSNTAVQVDQNQDEVEIGSKNFDRIKNSIEKVNFVIFCLHC